MPVTGAGTTAVKNAAMPTTANSVGWEARAGKPPTVEGPEEEATQGPQDQHRCKHPPGVPAA
jgi:hypothetical protein